MSRMLSLVRAGMLVCSVATSPALAQVAGEDLNGPPPAFSQQPMTQGQPMAQGQPPEPGQAPDQGQAQAHRFVERFEAANTTGDGRLTLAQAQAAGLPMIARHFDQIDAQHKGFVTLDDIRAFRQQMRAARQGGGGTAD
jgi:hypothetical protein